MINSPVAISQSSLNTSQRTVEYGPSIQSFSKGSVVFDKGFWLRKTVAKKLYAILHNFAWAL